MKRPIALTMCWNVRVSNSRPLCLRVLVQGPRHGTRSDASRGWKVRQGRMYLGLASEPCPGRSGSAWLLTATPRPFAASTTTKSPTPPTPSISFPERSASRSPGWRSGTGPWEWWWASWTVRWWASRRCRSTGPGPLTALRSSRACMWTSRFGEWGSVPDCWPSSSTWPPPAASHHLGPDRGRARGIDLPSPLRRFRHGGHRAGSGPQARHLARCGGHATHARITVGFYQ